MKASTPVKIAAAILTAVNILVDTLFYYFIIYTACWCFDTPITFKVASGIIIVITGVHMLLYSIFGGKK